LTKQDLLYEGKAKKVWTTADPDQVIVEFKDDATAFNGTKKGAIVGKGEINCALSTVLFQYLESYQVQTHFIQRLSAREMLTKRVEIVQVEAVMRNIATGSLVKRLAFPEAKQLDYPIFETYYKNDELGDPLINEHHAYALGIAKPEELRAIFRLTGKVNAILRSYFDRRGLILVDFKLEFGRFHGELLLADEISPDTCRIWDRKTHKKLDKDRFRFDMGGVEKAYQEVYERIVGA
jgi:phosphoribosylaminoimidazole-succinocarboxamide synthase